MDVARRQEHGLTRVHGHVVEQQRDEDAGVAGIVAASDTTVANSAPARPLRKLDDARDAALRTPCRPR